MIPADRPVPDELRHERFLATPLTARVAALDYASYMASPQVITRPSDGRWPVKGFTMADNLTLVAAHESEHRTRRTFTFVILDPTRSEALGCVHLNPLHDYLRRAGVDADWAREIPAAAAMVTFWLRQDQEGTGLAEHLVSALDRWVATDWPLDLHLFRVLPTELSSRVALERSGLHQLRVPLRGETRPYLWFGSASTTPGETGPVITR